MPSVPPYGAEFERDYRVRSCLWKSHDIIVVAGFSIFQLIGIRIKSILEYLVNSSVGRPEEAGVRIRRYGSQSENQQGWFDKLTTNGLATPSPFALSLSKGLDSHKNRTG